MKEPRLAFGPDLVRLIAEIDGFKGRREVLKTLSPDRLGALRKLATTESIGSSRRIEGAKLSDAQIGDLLSRAISVHAFKARDQQDVAGSAEAMDRVFEAWAAMRLAENRIGQLPEGLLRHSDKDQHHRGAHKALPNHVVALDADGREIGVVFETASPFDTPREMETPVAGTRKTLDEEALHPPVAVAVFIVAFFSRPIRSRTGTVGSRACSPHCCCCEPAAPMYRMPRWSASSKTTRTGTTRRSGARRRRSGTKRRTGPLDRLLPALAREAEGCARGRTGP